MSEFIETRLPMCVVVTECVNRVTESARLSSFFGSWDRLDDLDASTSTAIKFINKKDSHGQTPLQIALNNENVENAKILISRGASIDIK